MTNQRRRVRLLARAATAVLALCAADLAHAEESQPAPANPGSPAASKQASFGVQEVIVTARRREENLQRQPLSITALSTQQLERKNIQRLDDIVSVPNVNFNNQVGFVNTLVPFIRGIGEADPILTNDSPISVYVDGVLYARAIGSLLDIVEPERVEVLRGPQGSLFGRNTTGGAISITSQSPTDEFGASFRGGYASDNEITLRGILNTGDIKDTGLRMKVAYQHHQMDGFVRNLLTDDGKFWPGSDNTDAVYAHLHGGGDGRFTFDLRGDFTQTSTTLIASQTTFASPFVLATFSQSPNFGGDPFVVSSQYLGENRFSPIEPHSTSQVWGSSLTLNYELSPDLSIKSITAYRRLHTDTNPNTIGQGNIQLPITNSITGVSGVGYATPLNVLTGAFGYPGGDVSDQNQVSQEFQVLGKAGRHQYVGGLFFFHENVRERYISQVTFPSAFSPFLGPNCAAHPDAACAIFGGNNYKGTSESIAGYVSDTWTPGILDDRLEFTGGVRYTVDTKTLTFLTLPPLANPATFHRETFHQLSGDFTAKMQWTPDFMTYFRFANGYKSGGFSGRDDPNQEGYGPETANNFEIGFKGTYFDRRLRLNADLFYTKYGDKQVTTFLSGSNANNVQSSHVVSAAAARYYGGEIEATFIPMDGLQFDATFGYTDPAYTKFPYQDPATGLIVDISDQAVFAYFSKTTASFSGHYTLPQTSFGELTISANYAYNSGQYFHPSLVFNPLNEVIKSAPLRDLGANITLAHIPVLGGTHDVSISVYGKNLLDQHHRISGVDYEIAPGIAFGSNAYNRPRVIGMTLDLKY